MITVNGMDVQNSEATDVETELLSKVKNADLWQHGAGGVRDGKSRVTFNETYNVLGPLIHSLIPCDLPWRLNFLLGCNDQTLRGMRGPELLTTE